ncbi:MAG: ABC transporter permease [Rikenellaceae bacterium]
MRIFLKFIEKEFFHILRDKRTMMIMLVMPIVLVVLFGYAITNEVKSARFGVVDLTRNEESRRAIEQLSASDYFELLSYYENQDLAQEAMRRGDIELIVLMQDDKTQLLTNATDPNLAVQLSGYASQIVSPPDFSDTQIIPVTHLLYNPQMRGAYNFVPGVMGLILILICAMMTSVGIVKEKEQGTMEVLLVSPLKPIYIIIAKALPYLVISLVNIATILILATFLLEVPILGGVWVVLFVSVIYSLVALCLGLLVSTIVNSGQAAMLFCAVVLMLPVILLSGMIFPIENMPRPLQIISNIVPAKWYITALRKSMIMGLGFGDILREITILLSMMIAIIAMSVKRFKIRL